MLKSKKNIKKFVSVAMIALMIASVFTMSVFAIQRKSGSDGPLSGYLADNNAPNGGWVAYGDSICSQSGSITASVSVTYNDGVDRTANGSGSGSTAAYATSNPTTPGSVFKRESSSHGATIGTSRYSVSLSY
jgi:hypothetical protein